MTDTATEPEVTFPLDSFRDAARHLRRPFTPAAVKFKVQATWDGGGLIVAYIDARLAVERLNLIVPHLWHDEYEPLGNKHLICRLTVDGITRQDVGEGTGKGLYSDALKRAAVRFGIGVSLYAIPKMTLDVSSGALKEKRDKLELTPKGEKILRGTYEHWLDSHGSHAFGEPLDHGDTADALGDPDADVPAGVDPRTGEVNPHALEATPERKQLALDSLTFLLGDRRDVATDGMKAVKEALGVTPESIAIALSRIARVVQEADGDAPSQPTPEELEEAQGKLA